jgi:1-phosphatidylinositol-3-phosphate 5-kinase
VIDINGTCSLSKTHSNIATVNGAAFSLFSHRLLMPDTKKPLPALPQQSNVCALSVDARTHRARLIRHFFAEIADSETLARPDGWISAIEEALDALSQCLVSGEWLKGIRQRREAAHRAQLSSTLQTDKDKEFSRAQSPSPSKTPQAPVEPEKTKIQELLKQLRGHIVHSTGPTSDNSPFHLLLCLAPCGVRVHDPVPTDGPVSATASIGCSFVPSKFLLPPGDTESTETSVLYGLHEWDRQYPSLFSVQM